MEKHQVLRTLDMFISMSNTMARYHPLPDPLPKGEDVVVVGDISNDPPPSHLLKGEDNTNIQNIEDCHLYHPRHYDEHDDIGVTTKYVGSKEEKSRELLENLYITY